MSSIDRPSAGGDRDREADKPESARPETAPGTEIRAERPPGPVSKAVYARDALSGPPVLPDLPPPGQKPPAADRDTRPPIFRDRPGVQDAIGRPGMADSEPETASRQRPALDTGRDRDSVPGLERQTRETGSPARETGRQDGTGDSQSPGNESSADIRPPGQRSPSSDITPAEEKAALPDGLVTTSADSPDTDRPAADNPPRADEAGPAQAPDREQAPPEASQSGDTGGARQPDRSGDAPGEPGPASAGHSEPGKASKDVGSPSPSGQDPAQETTPFPGDEDSGGDPEGTEPGPDEEGTAESPGTGEQPRFEGDAKEGRYGPLSWTTLPSEEQTPADGKPAETDRTPTGEELLEMESKQSRLDSLRKTSYESETIEDVHDAVDSYADPLSKLFDRPPSSSQANVPVDHPQSLPAGTEHVAANDVVSAALVVGVLGVEATRAARHAVHNLKDKAHDLMERHQNASD